MTPHHQCQSYRAFQIDHVQHPTVDAHRDRRDDLQGQLLPSVRQTIQLV